MSLPTRSEYQDMTKDEVCLHLAQEVTRLRSLIPSAEVLEDAAHWIEQCPFENALTFAATLRTYALAIKEGAK